MDRKSPAMTVVRSVCLLSTTALIACSNAPGSPSGIAGGKEGGAPGTQQPRATEGKDYVVLERRRFLDEQGFDRPVEAFSVLVPRNWTSEGGVRWKGVGECRGEIISTPLKIASPDGAISFELMPVRSFGYANDQMMLQAMMADAQAGGCAINQPFTAAHYVEGFGQRDLGATVSAITTDEQRMERARAMDQQANAIAMQYGTGAEQSTTYARGELSWRDGTRGILEVGVTNIITNKPDMFSGGMSTFSTTSVFFTAVTRFPAARKEEAERMRALFISSHRVSPIWRQAKDNFLTQLGNVEHAGRMDRIRLMGEQARAYAQQRSEAGDQQMRDWERSQASQDASHERFVKTIREVETWSDGANGRVELTSGYDHAWSRGDGSYILSNSPNFDPSSVFQDQQWKPMVMER